jgi:hypothetical protein
MEVKFNKLRLLTVDEYEGFTNVIKRIDWEFVCTKGGKKSSGSGFTEFKLDTLDNFISIEDVTDAELEQWVRDGGFQAHWEDFLEMQEQALDKMIEEDSLTEYFVDPEYAKAVAQLKSEQTV